MIVTASCRDRAVQDVRDANTAARATAMQGARPQQFLERICIALPSSCFYFRLLAHSNMYGCFSANARTASARCKADANSRRIHIVVATTNFPSTSRLLYKLFKSSALTTVRGLSAKSEATNLVPAQAAAGLENICCCHTTPILPRITETLLS